MKYPKVSALVPEAEHFDESAVNEGVWLTAAHLNNIEQALTAPAQEVADLQQQLQAANDANAQLQEQMNARPTQESLDAANATIATLQEQVKTLGGQSSGNGTHVAPVVEEKHDGGGESGKLSITDEDHPLNISVKEEVKARENAKKVKQRYGF